MTWLISFIMGSKIARMVGAVALGVLTVLTFGQLKKREGRKEVEHRAKEEDHENAADIRDDVRNNLDDELRKHDTAGYRD